MRASIIIASHNEGTRLWRTVEAVQAACGKLDCEILVADDASTDGSTKEVKKRFPRIKVHSSKARRGASPTKDMGARLARGETLVFFDGHCNPEAGSIERLIAGVEKLRGNAILTPLISALDEDTWTNKNNQAGNGYAMDLESFDCWWIRLPKMKEVRVKGRSFYENPALIGCALAISRKLYEKLGGFDPHMRQWGSEDLDLGLKCWLMGYRILHDPKAIVGHRFQGQFRGYSIDEANPLANQLRCARKNLSASMWEEWLKKAQLRYQAKQKGSPEGLWAEAWNIYLKQRKSLEQERSYLLAHREHDEIWYAKKFNLPWPRLNAPAQEAIKLPEERASSLLVTPCPTPEIDSIDPDNGNQGDTVDVTLSGDFYGGGTVDPMDDIDVTDQDFVDQSTITATFVIHDDATVGDVDVTVTNECGSTSDPVTFTINQAPPEVDSVDPDYAAPGDTASVTITGRHFTGASVANVDVPGLTISGVSVVDDSTITATFSIDPSATPGAGEVSVSTTAGSDDGAFSVESASCTLTSQTAASEPDDRARTTLGVGEVITLNFSGSSPTWTVSGGNGSLVYSGSNATYSCGSATGSVTITAANTACSASITFTVVAPSSVAMQRKPGTHVEHNKGYGNIGACLNIYLGPDTVNFYNVYWVEVNVQATGTGSYSCQTGSYHCATGCASFGCYDTVTAGLGTQVAANDHAYSGYCDPSPPTEAGTLLIEIPAQWSLDDLSWSTFFTEEQLMEIENDHKTLTLYKCGATAGTTVGSRTRPYSCTPS